VEGRVSSFNYLQIATIKVIRPLNSKILDIAASIVDQKLQ